MSAPIRTLVEDYLAFASNETDKRGNKRATTTMTSYRRALEGFAFAVEQAGGDLSKLGEDFIEKNWVETQASIASQPIQLRVRAAAVKQFTSWLFRNNIPCAPMRPLQVQTPPPKPRKPKEVPVSTNVIDFANPAMVDDPIPSTTTYAPPPMAAPAVPPAYQAAQPVTPPPAAPPPPARASTQKAPVGSGRAPNPLAGMLPSGQYKLRVRRERELDEPVWVGDYPAERVATFGAVEPFLGREVAPRLTAQGITGDVTFIVSAVAPDGREGERARLTIAATASAPQPIPGAPGASVPAMTGGMNPNDLADVLAYHRRAQEEIEERLSKKMEQQQAQRPAQPEERRPMQNDELNDLKLMVSQLAGSVRSLSEQVQEQRMAPPARFGGFDEPMPAPQPATPQLDILAVIKEVAAMNKPSTPVTPQQPMGLAEVFNVMAQAKQMFQPQNVNIDVSPLEERIEEVAKIVAAQAKSKSRTLEMVEEFKAMKELFGLVGGSEAAPPTNGLGKLFGGLVDKIVNDPEPLAMAVERILTATATLKAAQTGATIQPKPMAPAQTVAVPDAVSVPMKAMLAANDSETLVVAAHEWLTAMSSIPATKKVTETTSGLLRDGKVAELSIYLRQVFAKLGMGEQAPAAKCATMAEALVAQVKAANAAAADDADGDDEDADVSAAPDFTVRVGGTADDADESDDEEEDAPKAATADEAGDEEDEEDEEEEDESSDDAPLEQDEVDEAVAVMKGR